MNYKISAIQMNSGESIHENLEKASHFIKQAAEQNCQLVVLPEMFALMSQTTEKKLAAAENFGEGKIQSFLKAHASEYKIWIVGGTIPIKFNDSEKVSACCLLYNPAGEVANYYNKIHLFDVVINSQEFYQESASIVPGKKIALTQTPFGQLGLAVCYDIRFPELFRTLFNQGAELFAVPAAFTSTTGKAHWEVLMRARAIENFSYVIGACQVGEHPGKRFTFGHSIIINPWGEIIAQLDEDIGIISAEINLDYLYEIRKKIPVKSHQKIFTTQ